MHRFLCLLAVSLSLFTHTMSASAEPSLIVSSERARFDESIDIHVKGVAPHARVEIQASLIDDDGIEWQSSGLYFASPDGAVDLTSAWSVGGTYKGVEAAGLFWSMLPATLSDLEAAVRDPERSIPRRPRLDYSKTYTYRLTARANGAPVAIIEIERYYLSDAVKVEEVDTGTIRGKLFIPETQTSAYGLVMVGGSSGGLETHEAALLAESGVPVLALAWHAYGDWPWGREQVPVEMFVAGLDWLSARLGTEKSALLGRSWGSEAASLTAHMAPEKLAGLILSVPSPMPTPGINFSSEKPFDVHKFSIAGSPVPFGRISFPDSAEKTQDIACGPDQPIDIRRYYLNSWNASENLEKRFTYPDLKAPVLLIGTTADEVWPSHAGADHISSRFKETGRADQVKTVIYPGAGHLMGAPDSVQIVHNLLYYGFVDCFISQTRDRSATAKAARGQLHEVKAFMQSLK